MLRILVVEDDSPAGGRRSNIWSRTIRATGWSAPPRTPTARSPRPRSIDPDLVLLDLHLAHGTTGFSVAVRLNDFGVAVPVRQRQGAALPDARPGARLPDEAVHRRGRPPLAGDGRGPAARPRDAAAASCRDNLTLYERERASVPPGAGLHPVEAVAADPARALDLGPPALTV